MSSTSCLGIARRLGRRAIFILALGALFSGFMVRVGPPAHAATLTALINGDTVIASVNDSSKSVEQILAEADGFTVTVVDGATWDSMTEAQFRAYNVLIVGDPDCNFIASSVLTNVGTWTKAVMDTGGNRFTIGSDPIFHSGADATNNRSHIIKDGIAFAGASSSATGAYVDTSCEASSNNNTILNDLSVGGTGWTDESPACAGNIGIVASNPAFSDTTDADLSNWFCSSHADYPTWAADWVPFAISADAPTQNYCANDIETKLQVCGEPYILVAGSGVVISSDITLTPTTASNPVGTSHTVTATVSKSGSPESGKTVTFTISAGPNVGATGSAVTDINGQATYTYTDTGGAGTDTILAQFTNDAGAVEEATASKTWVASSAAATTLTVNSATGDFADPTTVSAVLTSSGSPVAGKSVTLTLNGTETCMATTDGTGTASCMITPGEASGSYTLASSFAGDVSFAASSGSNTFVVTLEETTLSYTGATSAVNGMTFTMSGTLTTDDPSIGTALASKLVTFTLGSGGGAQTCTGTTNGTGSASCTISSVSQTVGSVPVSANFAGDTFYKPATSTSSANVFAPPATGAFVIGNTSAASAKVVNFWGSQWAKDNTLSGGTAPSAMKGFANSPMALTCGSTWTTTTGNSSAPPATIPGIINVVVSSSVVQNGSVISGTILHIVQVHVNPGYGPAPGHEGWGTIIGTIC